MSCDFVSLANPGVQALRPYQPGKPIEELQRELGIEHIVKLASNENPLGPGARAQQAICNHLAELARYPDGAGFALKQALAEKLSVRPSQITLGNGSNDVLNLIGLAFLNPSASAVFSRHAFVVYPIMTQYLGARAIEVPARDWGHDLAAMQAAIADDTRVIFIANPNNPTGTWLGHQALRRFLQQVPEHIVVVLDEAYAEYIHDVDYADGLALQREFANLVVTRTFSKAYGLAGLRAGYALASEQITDILNRVREPFNVNSLAQVAAVAALADDDHLQHSIRLNDDGRRQLEQGLAGFGLSFIPSQGNFICFDTGTDATAVYQKLLQQGVIVRPVVPYGMPHHLRVSIGLAAENDRFLDAMKAVL
ncbi:MAG TPA: histidinol-phosphate transaminase [Pseudomonadales bacterium]